MPTISGHFMKYQLATQLMTAANANTKRSHKIRGRTSLLRGVPLSTDTNPMLHWENCFRLDSCHSVGLTFPSEVQRYCGRSCPPCSSAAEQHPGMVKAGGRARPDDLPPRLMQGQGSSLTAAEQG